MSKPPTTGKPPHACDPIDGRSEVFLRYLEHFRADAVAKLDGLDDADLRGSRLPSGWSPLELLKHLAAMERRWLVWGFAGEQLADPWYDCRDGRWALTPEDTLQSLTAELEAGARRTREIVTGAALDQVGAPSDRWEGAPPATLERVLFHVLQEYARHLGQLDVTRELIDGTVSGEG